MKQIRLLMGMPVTVEVVEQDDARALSAIERAFDYFVSIDERFSTYKQTSEITKINRGLMRREEWSEDMKAVFALSEQTKRESGGYFDIALPQSKFTPATQDLVACLGEVPIQYDPSGLVKGWAIHQAAGLIEGLGHHHFFVDAGGDIQVKGKNARGETWKVGIRDPFDASQQKIIKTLYLKDEGIATSGTYIRGHHIYVPRDRGVSDMQDIVSLTVVGPNAYESDRFATAAFAMGRKGIEFIEARHDLEGYMVDRRGIAVMTSGFEKYTDPLRR